MAEFVLSREQTVPVDRKEVFDFFSDAGNLELLTPPQLGFNIITPQPIKIERGTLIDYKISLRGIPLTWRTEITLWDPPFQFVDTQLNGPYKQWIHTHTFTEIDGGTLIADEVKYRLIFEPFGDLVHFLVRRELETIFDFRYKKVAEIFK